MPYRERPRVWRRAGSNGMSFKIRQKEDWATL
jgi:hypothetical protein